MLIKLEHAHLDLILEWRNDPNVRRNMYSNHLITKEEHIAWFNSLQNDPSCQYFVFCRLGVPRGVIYFTNLEPFPHQAMWGFYGAPLAPKGNGVLMELDALEFAFKTLKLPKLNCEVLSTNKHVINLHSKAGFETEGLFRDYHFDGEHYVSVVRMGMLRTQWPSAKKILEARIAKLNDGITP